MGSYAGNVAGIFAAGDTIGAYPEANWQQNQLPPSGSPKGSADATGVVATDGSLSITGLTDGRRYFLAKNTAGTRYVNYRCQGAPESREPLFGAFADGEYAKWDSASQSFIGATPASGASFPLEFAGAAAAPALETKVTGDTDPRFSLQSDGLWIGPGNGALEAKLYRGFSNQLWIENKTAHVPQLGFAAVTENDVDPLAIDYMTASIGGIKLVTPTRELDIFWDEIDMYVPDTDDLTGWAHFLSKYSDADARFGWTRGGVVKWGGGALAPDVTLYRAAADQLKTDDLFIAALGLSLPDTGGTASKGITFGGDNTLSRTAAGNAINASQRLTANSYIMGTVEVYARQGLASQVIIGAVSGKPGIQFGNAGTVGVMAGAGSPEGAVTAGIGAVYLRTDGGAATSMYVKESGTGNTGWVAK